MHLSTKSFSDRIRRRNHIITDYYEFSIGDEFPITIGRWLVGIGSAKKRGKLGLPWGWYVFNSRACLSPEINRFFRTNSSIRRTESYLTKIKSCCRVVSRFEIVSPSLFEVHARAYVFDYVGRFSVSDCLRCQREKRQQRKHVSHSRMTVTGVGQLIWGSAWLLFRR